MLTTALLALAAVLLDGLLGEPRRWHPLVGFGGLAGHIERTLYGDATLAPQTRRLRGVLALLILLLPFTVTAAALTALPYVGIVFSLLMLYAAIGHRSLHDHARPVAAALRNNQSDEARRLVARMVSRDSAALDITGAATESVLENGNDGVFGALFWFVIAGGAGAILYRLANTLDAMWGYRNARYRNFGWAAARFDDVLNFIPARLTALTYAALGETRQALNCWRLQAPAWDSPNAGPVMAAGAGALGIAIGGPARYLGEWHQRPVLGVGENPVVADIERALRLVRRGVWLWLGLLVASAVIAHA
jgi:adenosylcobinamide-phosphate synthase